LARVRSLVRLYDVASAAATDDASAASDILRAAVVLLHAVLEEYVRHVLDSVLPLGDKEQLDDIPLAGDPRGPKFTLAGLAEHRGSTVDAVITQSVRDYLDKTSLTSLSNALGILEKRARIRLTQRSIDRRALDRFIKRRHQIVHQADRLRRARRLAPTPQAISRRTVLNWLADVEGLILAIDRQWRGLKQVPQNG
jgi:hypothetical protein